MQAAAAVNDRSVVDVRRRRADIIFLRRPLAAGDAGRRPVVTAGRTAEEEQQ